jgi:hypothetical protein
MTGDKSKGQRHYAQKQQPPFPEFEGLPEKPEQTQTADTRENKQEDNTPMLGQIYNRLFEGKAAAWTAIFTCVLAVFSYLLWEVSKEANNTSAATQAASVSSFGPSLVKVTNADGKTLKGYNIFFTWINNGTTPTRSALMQANVSVGQDRPSKGLDFSSLPQSQSLTAVLGPRAGIQMPPAFISTEDVESVQDGKKHMFFWGWAVYHDVFSSTARLSEYCFDVQGATWTKADHNDATGDLSLATPPCGVHFCFNEECEDYQSRTK